MSLADMGLRNLPRQSSFEQNTRQEEEGLGEEEEDLEDMVADVTEEIIPPKDMLRPGSSKLRTAMLIEEDDGGGPIILPALPMQANLEDDEAPRKRRRLKPDLPSPPDSNEAVTVIADGPQAMSKIQAAANPNTEAFTADSHNIDQAGAPVFVPPAIAQNKKRKAAEEPEANATGSTASSRAKRVASTAAKNSSSFPTSARTTRSTRTK